jgi:tRNA(Ile)-lysidine synthase
MELVTAFKNYIQQQRLFHTKDKLLLAVSGGIDSVVLCQLCQQCGYDFAIAHCNFQLRGADSDKDENFVQQLATTYAVPFFTIRFDTATIAAKQKKTIEEAARDLRYAWFETLRLEHGFGWLVTAHHANDSIETAMMYFFRGTGIKGLHGILPKQNKIVRPLLFAKKDMLLQFAAANALQFVNDATNQQNDFTRNYFRNELLPGVKKVFPAVEENLLHNIARIGEAEQLYEQAIAWHKKKLLVYHKAAVHIPVLKLQQTKPLFTVLYEIIKDFGFTPHQTADVAALLQSDNGKYVQSATHRIIRNRKWLLIAPTATQKAAHIIIETTDGSIAFENGKLQFETIPADALKLSADKNTAQLDAAILQLPLLLRQWKQGDYFYPLGMTKKKKLSRFFIDQKLATTEKEKVWVLESNKKIVWVIGMRIDDRCKITAKTKTVVKIRWSIE